MNGSLKKHHTFFAILICLSIHAVLLTVLMIMELQESQNQQEPIILVADQEELHPTPEQLTREQWVAMNNSLPNAQFMNDVPPQDQPAEQTESTLPDLPKQEVAHAEPEVTPEPAQKKAVEKVETEPLIEESSIDDALSVAMQYLKEELPELVQGAVTPEKADPVVQKKPEPQEKKITLAQIAQGFMQQVQESPMAVASDQQGPASMEQLKQLHYCQKIIGCIVNSYKINKYNAPGVKQDNRLAIHLAIKQDGSIHTLRIVQSSGNHSLDQFVLSVFKDASSSFPPLPQSFKQIPFHLPFFNIDHVESLHTTQGWYIDSRRS